MGLIRKSILVIAGCAFGIALFVLAMTWKGELISLYSESLPLPHIVTPVRYETPLKSAYGNRSLYEAAFSEAMEVSRIEKPLAVVTSHHFLAAPLIARSFATVANPSIQRIILVSPDHFQSRFEEGTSAFTTSATWDTFFGTLEPDVDFLEKMKNELPTIAQKRAPFLGEHGIYTEIPFLGHYFPQAKIVPIILKNTFEYETFVTLGKSVRDMATVEGETLVVISSDFSHHATHASAQVLDRKNINVLQYLNEKRFSELGNDCRSCIAFLAGYLESPAEESEFHLLEQKDSTDFGGQDSDVTSYVSGVFTLEKKQENRSAVKEEEVTLLFGGDMMFDRYIRTAMRKHGDDFPLALLQETLNDADVVVANLEGPVTDNESMSEMSQVGSRENYFFTFDSSVARVLKKFNIGVVNLGNNHILNFKEDGVVQTKKNLSDASVLYFGSPLSGDERILIRDIRGTKFAFVNYNQFVSRGKERALEDLKRAGESADVVILYAHWGKEYVDILSVVRELAHEFVDAGADLVIGSHPHVVQGKEVYQGKTIYYSLGNMVFDQYENEATKNGLFVRALFNPKTKNFIFQDIPINLKNNGQTMLVEKKD